MKPLILPARPRPEPSRALLAVGASLLLVLSMPGVAMARAAGGHQIRGLVVAGGHPIEGARISILAVPTTKTLHATKEGETLALPELAVTYSGNRGRFGADVNVPDAYIDENGVATLETIAATSTGRLSWTFTLEVGRRGAGSSTVPTQKAILFDFGAASGAQDYDATAMAPDEMPAATTLYRQLVDPSIDPDFACTISPTSNYKNGLDERFADVWSWSGALVDFKQVYGTSHSLGIGGQYTGYISQVGVTTLSETWSTSTQHLLYDQAIHNAVNYREYLGSCWSPTYRWYPDSPNQFFTAVPKLPLSAHPTNYVACADKVNNTYTKASGTNTTYSAGVDTKSGFLSAQAGWSQSSETTFNFGSVVSRFCASTAAGVDSSPQVEAHKK